MCYLCLKEFFNTDITTNKVGKAKDRALEIKNQLKEIEAGNVVACNEVIASLKEEQYKLSREM